MEATRVAEWAGHTMAIVLHVYVKFLDVGEHAARARVEAALRGQWTAGHNKIVP